MLPYEESDLIFYHFIFFSKHAAVSKPAGWYQTIRI